MYYRSVNVRHSSVTVFKKKTTSYFQSNRGFLASKSSRFLYRHRNTNTAYQFHETNNTENTFLTVEWLRAFSLPPPRTLSITTDLSIKAMDFRIYIENYAVSVVN